MSLFTPASFCTKSKQKCAESSRLEGKAAQGEYCEEAGSGATITRKGEDGVCRTIGLVR
jgi:hypothetical protein